MKLLSGSACSEPACVVIHLARVEVVDVLRIVLAGAGSRCAGRTAGCCADYGCADVVGVGVGNVEAGGVGGGGGGVGLPAPIIGGALLFTKLFGRRWLLHRNRCCR